MADYTATDKMTLGQLINAKRVNVANLDGCRAGMYAAERAEMERIIDELSARIESALV